MAFPTSYRELFVWQRSLDLAVEIYKVTREFPEDEILGLTADIRRSATSVPAKIAGGQDRWSTAEFLQALDVVRGVLAELETLIIISKELGYLEEEIGEGWISVCAEVNKGVKELIKSLSVNRKLPPPERN